MNILRLLTEKLENFYLFDPCRTKILTIDLFLITTKGYLGGRPNYIGMTRLLWFLTTLKQLLNLTPIIKLFRDPLPYCTRSDMAAI